MVVSRKNGAFNSRTAILLAAMSYQTYPLYLQGAITLPAGFQLRYVIRASANVENPQQEVFGFVAESPEMIIVAFRGYASYPADLIAAYDILQIPYPYVSNGGMTSRGFTCIYQSTREQLIEQLSHLPSSKGLYVTGHNYGGALATLATLDIAINSQFSRPVVYTYGSARVGDPAFAFRFNRTVRNSVRVLNIHDSFPTFPARDYPPPFTQDGLRYQHVKHKYQLSFQLNNTPRNDSIGCYFQSLARLNPQFAQMLCNENEGFCPNPEMCFPFQDGCKCQQPVCV